jgi:GT2 family glycosyltransferase
MRLAGFRIAYRPEATVIHGYRRTTAQRQLSRKALEHAFGFAYFQWKWRRSRRALRAQAEAMEQRGWRLEAARPAPAGSAASHSGGA